MEKLERKLLLKPLEAAALLSVSKSRIYSLIATGAVPSVRLDGTLRIPRIALEQAIDALARDHEAGQ